MVRGRAGIARGRGRGERRRRSCAPRSSEHVPDPEERAWSSRGWRTCSASRSAPRRDREDLFAAWRRFFERLAEHGPRCSSSRTSTGPTSGLLDFVEYLLDWSRQPPDLRPHARPARARRAAPGLGRRQAQLHVAAARAARRRRDGRAADGLVPGLPDDVARRASASAAEGIPLFAVETVRMLLDRGLLVADGDEYRVTGESSALEVPETLHALIAARLDGARAGGAQALQDAAVLGKTFTRRGLAALSGLDRDELEQLVGSLCARRCSRSRPTRSRPSAASSAFLQASSSGHLRDDLAARPASPPPRRGRASWPPTAGSIRTRSQR